MAAQHAEIHASKGHNVAPGRFIAVDGAFGLGQHECSGGNLRGIWLEQAGFTIGTTYIITAYDKQLIFTAD